MRAIAISIAMLLTAPAMAEEIGQGAICKAAIGAIMGRDPQTIEVDREAEGVTYLSYVRTDDQTTWAYRCRLDGQNVLWATPDGPWRDRPGDEAILFEVAGDPPDITIHQVFGDGSELEETHPASGL